MIFMTKFRSLCLSSEKYKFMIFLGKNGIFMFYMFCLEDRILHFVSDNCCFFFRKFLSRVSFGGWLVGY